MTLKLGHSPDSDDAFMFYGLAAGKVDAEGLTFEHLLRDIETLNQWAREGRLEVTALSVHAYATVSDRYALLNSGASMGEDYGPMVVTREPCAAEDLRGKRIAVPGLLTSAYLALRLYQPDFREVVVPFDRIMDAVSQGEVDAGLLIHEGQLTHRAAGLHTVVDLGVWWKGETGLPLPLGVNAVRRDLGDEVLGKVARALKASILYGLEHREEALAHALGYARGLDTAMADRFVGMYVNQRTVDMGDEGRRSVELFLTRGYDIGLLKAPPRVEFVG